MHCEISFSDAVCKSGIESDPSKSRNFDSDPNGSCVYHSGSGFGETFAKTMKKRLEQLQSVTQKISENDLEFAVQTTDIKEINRVLYSLEHMKDALQKSLRKQWDMEAEQTRQVRALVHDIKTPLTIIKGNAELSAEDVEEMLSVSGEASKPSAFAGSAACQKQILEHTEEMEEYLEKIH